MDLENFAGKMEKNILVFIEMIEKKVLVFILGKNLKKFLLDFGLMENKMVLGNIWIVKELNLVFGKMEKS